MKGSSTDSDFNGCPANMYTMVSSLKAKKTALVSLRPNMKFMSDSGRKVKRLTKVS